MKEFLLAMLPWIVVPPLVVGVWSAVYRRRHPLTSEQLETVALLKDVRWPRSGLAATVFLVVYIGVYALRGVATLPALVRAGLLVPPVLAFVWFTVVRRREERSNDELERRVQGEASANATWMFLFWSLGMWIMNEIWPAPLRARIDKGLVFLPVFYVLGMFAAKARLMPAERSNDAGTS
jgi:fatty acid desaturase